MIPIPFIVLTFSISLAGFACLLALPAARSPHTATGLPFWLVMVWGPSLAAIILAARNGNLAELFGRVIQISTIPLAAWVLVLSPLFLLFALRRFATQDASPVSGGHLVAIVVLHLMLGALGEELGWRGVLQEHLNAHIGWLESSLIVGVIWLIWHLPLWTIDTPHAEINLPLFAVHCLLYSVIIGAAYTLSASSLLPAILLHLTVNLAAELAVLGGFGDTNAWYRASRVPYFFIAIIAIALVFMDAGLQEASPEDAGLEHVSSALLSPPMGTGFKGFRTSPEITRPTMRPAPPCGRTSVFRCHCSTPWTRPASALSTSPGGRTACGRSSTKDPLRALSA